MIELRADIAANVWKVLVTPGQAVGAGDELIVLESMKMEIPVEAPSDGTIGAVHVEEGAQVAEGDVMISFEG